MQSLATTGGLASYLGGGAGWGGRGLIGSSGGMHLRKQASVVKRRRACICVCRGPPRSKSQTKAAMGGQDPMRPAAYLVPEALPALHAWRDGDGEGLGGAQRVGGRRPHHTVPLKGHLVGLDLLI
jgi:hypothetical protein